jgi:hypothetical protein
LSSFWFILKQQWTIEEIYIFSNSSHLKRRAGDIIIMVMGLSLFLSILLPSEIIMYIVHKNIRLNPLSILRQTSLSPEQQYFSYFVAVSFIGGGNRRTQRKPPTCHKLLNFLNESQLTDSVFVNERLCTKMTGMIQ